SSGDGAHRLSSFLRVPASPRAQPSGLASGRGGDVPSRPFRTGLVVVTVPTFCWFVNPSAAWVFGLPAVPVAAATCRTLPTSPRERNPSPGGALDKQESTNRFFFIQSHPLRWIYPT